MTPALFQRCGLVGEEGIYLGETRQAGARTDGLNRQGCHGRAEAQRIRHRHLVDEAMDEPGHEIIASARGICHLDPKGRG